MGEFRGAAPQVMGLWRARAEETSLHCRMIAAALPFVLFGFVAPALSQTADELIAKNLAARGGADRLAAIHTVVSRGELRFPGDFKLAFKETKSRTGGSANAARVEATIEGLTVIQAFDGTNAWRVNPFEGRKDAERMGSDETRELADDESRRPLLDDERADPVGAFRRIGHGEYGHDVGHAAVRDPDLRAVEHVLVAVAPRLGAHRTGRVGP